MKPDNMLFLRGARLVQFLNEDATYNQLYQNISQNFDTSKRQNAANEASVQNITYTADTGKGVLLVTSKVSGSTGTYNVHIEFLDVAFGGGAADVRMPDGSVLNLQPIDLNATNVKVACSCMDFYFRFALWNFNADAHYGPMPQPYQRKTTTRPPVNPARVPGVCKHIIATIETLQKTGVCHE